MKFTYESYIDLIELLSKSGYQIASYDNYESMNKCAVIRHDVDYSLEKAVTFAKLENRIGVISTYFVMVTNNFYNIFSESGGQALREITDAGHEIGLHFDEKRYQGLFGKAKLIKRKIYDEGMVLSYAIGKPVKCVSMHRPSKEIIESNLEIEDMVNSYGRVFFNDFKYVSDSRRRWREPIEELIKSGRENRLHILTHPFWYNNEEKSIEQSISEFVDAAFLDRYNALNNNITDLTEILSKPSLEGHIGGQK